MSGFREIVLSKMHPTDLTWEEENLHCYHSNSGIYERFKRALEKAKQELSEENNKKAL